MSKFFKDIGKDSRDLLSQDFPSGSAVTVVAEAKTPNGIVIKPTLKRFYKKEKSLDREYVELSLEPKVEWKDKNTEFTGKISTAKDINGTITIKELLFNGSKLEVNGALNEKEGLITKTTSSYKSETFTDQLSVTYPYQGKVKGTKQPIKVNGEAVFQYPKHVFWGLNVNAEAGDKPKAKAEGSAAYYSEDWQVTSRVSHEFQSERTNWGFSFFHIPSSLVKYSIDFDVDASSSDTRGPIAKVGGEYKLDSDTTLKGKVTLNQAPEPDLRLELSAKQRVSKHLTAVFGSNFNARQLLGTNTGEPHSFGLELKLE